MKRKIILVSAISLCGVIAATTCLSSMNRSLFVNGAESTWWENDCVLPEGYTSIHDINANGVKNNEYLTRGTVTEISSNQFFIESQGSAICIYDSNYLDTLQIGQVVDVEGSFTIYNKMNELTNLTYFAKYADENPYPVVPLEINAVNFSQYVTSANASRLVKFSELKFVSKNTRKIYFTCGEEEIYMYLPASGYSALANDVCALIEEAGEDSLVEFTGVMGIYNTDFQLRLLNLSQINVYEGKDVAVTSITVSPSNTTIYSNKTQKFTASVLPKNATDKSLTWSCNNGGTITSTGVFTPNGVGTYTVTATANDGSGVTDSTTINVVDAPEASNGVVVTNPTLENGVLGPLYIPDEKDYFSVSYLEMISMYGDSILIDYGNFEMIIDGGSREDGENVMAALKNVVDDGQVEIMVNTHPHVDHFGGLSYYDDYEEKAGITNVKYLIECGGNHSTINIADWQYTVENLVENGTIRYTNYEMIHNEESGYPNEILITEDISIKILDTGHYVPSGYPINDQNESSIAMIISIGDTRYFLTGDCTNDTDEEIGKVGSEDTLIANYANTGLWSKDTLNIVKANHHGSQTHGSNSQNWADATLPDYVIFSSAIVEANRTPSGVVTANHPYVNSINHYLANTEECYWNGINGTITFTHFSLDDNPTMSFAGRTIDYYDKRTGEIVDREAERCIRYQDSVFAKTR